MKHAIIYEEVRFIAHGGMGKVYEAEGLELEQSTWATYTIVPHNLLQIMAVPVINAVRSCVNSGVSSARINHRHLPLCFPDAHPTRGQP